MQLQLTSVLQPPVADAMAIGLLVNALELRDGQRSRESGCDRMGEAGCKRSGASASPPEAYLTETADAFTLALATRIAAVFDADESGGRKCGADGSAEEPRQPACERLHAFLKFRRAAIGAAQEASRLDLRKYAVQVKQICLGYETAPVSEAETRHLRDIIHANGLVTALAGSSANTVSLSRSRRRRHVSFQARTSASQLLCSCSTHQRSLSSLAYVRLLISDIRRVVSAWCQLCISPSGRCFIECYPSL